LATVATDLPITIEKWLQQLCEWLDVPQSSVDEVS
jgi:hypothetical protein